MSDEYIKIVFQAIKQLKYDVQCLGDEEVVALSRIIRGYLISQGMFSETEEKII